VIAFFSCLDSNLERLLSLVGLSILLKIRLESPERMMHATTLLYRPVGQKEMDLIRESGDREFPPRLPEQPIFYPVLNQEYATHIARDWNTKDESGVGYVTRFRVRSDYLQRYAIKTVGGSIHQEYWIPAEDLAEFNRHIVGEIEVIAEFRATTRGLEK
jgi:hypothetical protein